MRSTWKGPLLLASCAAFLLLTGARQRAVRPVPPVIRVAPADAHSFSNAAAVAVQHLSLDLDVDFEAQQIRGSATLTIRNPSGSDVLLLDSDGLDIQRVTLDGGEEGTFSLGHPDPILGRALRIPIHPSTTLVRIDYATGPGAAGLNWMSPEQAQQSTPFLYTQNEAIDARSWIPIQDSPSVRMTYDATVRVPPGLLAVMSAENPTAKSADGVYRFRMSQPIPAYLIGLAVADLEFRAIDERTGVYAAPERVDAAARELAVVPRMLDTASLLWGPYVWSRYDVAIMPPCYHIGGMEHPRLTFATPSFIAGDGSLVTLIAHELAHSWTGDLVTTATWNDIWLNEGITVYLERRIMEATFGRDYSEMLAFNGRENLQALVGSMGADNPDTRLHENFNGRNPDTLGFSSIPYEKGYSFMRMLEEGIGRERLDELLRQYSARYAFSWMDAGEFLAFLRARCLDAEPGIEEQLRVAEWIHEPGLPANTPQVVSSRFAAVDGEVRRFSSGTAARQLNTASWSPHEFIYFLRSVGVSAMRGRMSELDSTFAFSSTTNLNLLFRWALWTAILRNEPTMPALERYLMAPGSASGLNAVYGTLAGNGNRSRALEIYGRARSRYHPNSRALIDATLGITGKSDVGRAAAMAGKDSADRDCGACTSRDGVALRK